MPIPRASLSYPSGPLEKEPPLQVTLNRAPIERDALFAGPPYNYPSEFPVNGPPHGVMSIPCALLPISFQIPERTPPPTELPQREMLPIWSPPTIS